MMFFWIFYTSKNPWKKVRLASTTIWSSSTAVFNIIRNVLWQKWFLKDNTMVFFEVSLAPVWSNVSQSLAAVPVSRLECLRRWSDPVSEWTSALAHTVTTTAGYFSKLLQPKAMLKWNCFSVMWSCVYNHVICHLFSSPTILDWSYTDT